MGMPAKQIGAQLEHGAAIGVFDPELARRLERHIERMPHCATVLHIATLPDLFEITGAEPVGVIVLDGDLLPSSDPGARPADALELIQRLAQRAPIVLLAPAEWQREFAGLVADGRLDFVARRGDFVPLAASLVERRLRWSGPPSGGSGGPAGPGTGEIFRHEVNNPLTGILGNAEMLLAHPERFSAGDQQRLQTIVDLAVRLRDTIRRISNGLEERSRPAPAGFGHAEPPLERKLR